MITCKCGIQIPNNAIYCHICGRRNISLENKIQEKPEATRKKTEHTSKIMTMGEAVTISILIHIVLMIFASICIYLRR